MRQRTGHWFLYAVILCSAVSFSCGPGGTTSSTSSQIRVSSLQLNPSSVIGGQSSTGTATLNQAAPSGGSVVTLGSNNAVVQVPGSVTVAAGSTSATFTATVSTVSSTVVATVTATLNGTAQANLTVNPSPVGAPPAQLFIAGLTQSTDFPLVNASRTTLVGGQEGALTTFNRGQTNYIFSTYVGGNGSNDQVRSMAFDALGNIYVAGYTNSTDLQTTPGAFQTTYGGGGFDCFIQEYSPTGTLLASTYLGGSDEDLCYTIGIDAQGNVHVAGRTASPNFPVSSGAFQTSLGGQTDQMMAEFTPDLKTRIWATYFGGSGTENARRLYLDSSSNTYVVGVTGSNNFPASPGAFQTVQRGTLDNATVVKLDLNGNRVWATYIGGTAPSLPQGAFGGVVVDSTGKVYFCGTTTAPDFPTTAGAYQTSLHGSQDAFVSVLAANGASLVGSTYLGGSGTEACQGITLDSQGNVIVTAFTSSTDYPTTAGAFQTTFGGGAQDMAVTKLNPGLTALVWSTYFGGNGTDSGDTLRVRVDANDNVYFIFSTDSTNLPVTSNAIQSTFGGGTPNGDMAVAVLSSNGKLVIYCTYLGGSGDEFPRELLIR